LGLINDFLPLYLLRLHLLSEIFKFIVRGEILSDTECNFQERDVSGEGFSPITGQIKRMMIEP
ncbi:hypothetical protein RCS97_10260, partial [Escherichia marmotae]|nr:hypothetical protein [Escherichia marmotae]